MTGNEFDYFLTVSSSGAIIRKGDGRLINAWKLAIGIRVVELEYNAGQFIWSISKPEGYNSERFVIGFD